MHKMIVFYFVQEFYCVTSSSVVSSQGMSQIWIVDVDPVGVIRSDFFFSSVLSGSGLSWRDDRIRNSVFLGFEV